MSMLPRGQTTGVGIVGGRVVEVVDVLDVEVVEVVVVSGTQRHRGKTTARRTSDAKGRHLQTLPAGHVGVVVGGSVVVVGGPAVVEVVVGTVVSGVIDSDTQRHLGRTTARRTLAAKGRHLHTLPAGHVGVVVGGSAVVEVVIGAVTGVTNSGTQRHCGRKNAPPIYSLHLHTLPAGHDGTVVVVPVVGVGIGRQEHRGGSTT
jgi:hypothetical protein